jgi:hypothetical protein
MVVDKSPNEGYFFYSWYGDFRVIRTEEGGRIVIIGNRQTSEGQK